MKDSLNILSTRIDQLEQKIDSLNQSAELQQLTYELNSKQDLISKVNEFYDSAWLKLIIVISVLGILVPIVVQYFQRKNLKDLSEFIRNQMNDNFDRRIKELEELNKTKIEDELKDFKEKLTDMEEKNSNLITELDANTFFLQGRSNVLSKHYYIAIQSFIKSSFLFLDSNRPERAKVPFVNLNLCLKVIKEKKTLEQINQSMKNSSFKLTLDEMIIYFQNHDKKELYIDELKTTINELERIKNNSY